MDGQRQYRADQHAAEPDGWLPVQPDDDRGFVPGQRGTDRYGEPERYADEPSRRQYGDQGYGDQQGYVDQPGYGDPQTYGEPAGYGEQGYDTGDQFADPNGQRRRRSTRPVRVGKRSGLDLPDVPHDDPGPEEPPRYRAEMIDRQALRRDGAPGYPAQAVEAFPAYAPVPPQPQPPASQSVAMPLQAPTQSIPSAPPPPAVYLARRPSVAALIGTVTAGIELLLLPVLLNGVIHAHGNYVLGAIFGLTGVPMVAIGLYALARGAVTAHGPDLLRAWLRPPLAYLPIGLVLIVAAGMAA